MQRRKFIQSSLAATAGTAAALDYPLAGGSDPAQRELYEWREYEMRFGGSQKLLEDYLKNALIPALNKYGVKSVGVFREWRPSDPVRVFLLTPYSSFESYLSVNAKVKADEAYNRNSAVYNAITVDKAVYNRFASTLMMAFDGFPKMVVPAGEARPFYHNQENIPKRW